MKIVEFRNLTPNQNNAFLDFLQEASLEFDQPAHENMWAADWSTKSNTLPYILYYTDRFKVNGAFHVIFHGDECVACGGIYQADFSDQVAIAGVRTWVKDTYRNRLIPREVLLPAHKQWAIDNGYRAVALTFNDYNKNLIKLWKRMRLGENRSKRAPHHMFYSNLVELDHPITIRSTKQWVIYELLDADDHVSIDVFTNMMFPDE